MDDVLDAEEDEQVVSIHEYIEGMEAQQLEADLVLGGDEGKDCTYEKGYLGRQAVFSCLTCTPAGNAGVCIACSIACHDGHKVVELWTRRRFRCDCGNDKFGDKKCTLYEDKEATNAANIYSQNYRGLYCTCHRPYPDPDGSELGEMLQCCICEDWFHEAHLGLSPSQQVPRDKEGEPYFEELICPLCAGRCSFLSHYPELQVLPTESPAGEEDAQPALSAEAPGPLCSPAETDAEEGLKRALVSTDGFRLSSDSSSSTRDSSGEGKSSCNGSGDSEAGEPSSSEAKLCKLKRPLPSDSEELQGKSGGDARVEGVKADKAVFLLNSWRAELCRCAACLAMYVAKGVGYLLDGKDTLLDYEEMAKEKRKESQEKEAVNVLDFMKNLGHVQKIELLHGFNDMATKLGSFLTPFSEAGKTVTSADIHEFFENLQNKRRRMH